MCSIYADKVCVVQSFYDSAFDGAVVGYVLYSKESLEDVFFWSRVDDRWGGKVCGEDWDFPSWDLKVLAYKVFYTSRGHVKDFLVQVGCVAGVVLSYEVVGSEGGGGL